MPEPEEKLESEVEQQVIKPAAPKKKAQPLPPEFRTQLKAADKKQEKSPSRPRAERTCRH
jgi:hypothetical protein